MTDKQIPNERRQYEYKSVYTNTDNTTDDNDKIIENLHKQIIKPRPICLYEDTCLHLKEKTRLCEDCVHHKNYWSELLEKEQLEKIKSLEQECEELKDKLNCCFCNPYVELNDIEKRRKCVEVTECFRRQLDQLKLENEHLSEKEEEARHYLKEAEKFKNCLTEIKKICKTNVCKHCHFKLKVDDNYCKNIKDCDCYKILQKISECETI